MMPVSNYAHTARPRHKWLADLAGNIGCLTVIALFAAVWIMLP